MCLRPGHVECGAPVTVDRETAVPDRSGYCSSNGCSSVAGLNSKEFRPDGLKIAILKLFDSPHPKDKMVGSNGTMIAIRLVRSKLRKREEHSNSVHPADVVQTAGPAAPSSPPQAFQSDTLTYQGQFLWPPPAQPYLYNNDQVGPAFLCSGTKGRTRSRRLNLDAWAGCSLC